MKKILLLLLFITSLGVYAQAPPGIPYQAIARNANGNALVNQSIKVRFSILTGSINGTTVYIETHTTNTTNLGLFTLTVGSGIAQTGTFQGINWASGSKFLQVEIDPAGGNNYINLGASQMQSVPYALYSASSGTPGVTGPQGPMGATGSQGMQGQPGATGAQGNPGIQGVAGATGMQGIQGATGPAGAMGASGIQGITGATGATGIQGPIGVTGAQGNPGIQGPIGATGIQGIQGATGPAGATGLQGIQGFNGGCA